MPTQLQLRRGTTVQHSSFTGAVGEVTINTTKKTAVVHDGSTAGGLELLRADMSNIFSSATPTITSLNTTGNVDVGGNLTVTGTSTFNGGTINLGDAAGDNVVFGADINSNIIPNTDNTYNLGSAGQKWANLNVVNITQTGNTTTSGTLTVTGETNLNGGLKLDTDKFTVADATGNTAIAGTLGVTGDTTLTGDLAVNGGDLTTSQTTFNLLNSTATTLNIGGAATSLNLGAATGTTTVGNNLTVTGDLTVNGNTTTLSTSTLEVEDKNILIAKGAVNDAAANDAGIVVESGDGNKSILWKDATDAFTSSEHIETAAGKTLALSGSSSGKTTINVAATASGTLTLPSATDTLVGRATTDTLTNKSISFTNNTITATSAELATAISDETGSGSLVFATSPTLVTPTIGVATATSVNKVAITAPATGSTLTIADGKTLTANNTLTLTGTDSSSIAFGAGGTVTYTSNKLSAFSSTSSSELASVISDETGTGALVFGTSPTLTTPVISSIVNTGTLTLPTSTDTLVGRATTDTLTNKSISLTTNTISGTLAEFNTALSDDNFVSLTGAETLTNKTLTSPKIANGGFIADANGNEQLIFNTTASAVNELTLTKGTGTILVGNSIIPSSDSTMDLGATGARFRDLYLSGASIIMGTTKIMMHADGYLQFNTNSAGGYPAGSNVSVATAANGVAATNSNALAYSIALGGA
ncbi:hypothetical protein EBU71_05020 [bacterium]|nr:hypothetical protein [Candidatus Elulimicrobium humile]